MESLFKEIKNEPLKYLFLPKIEGRTTYQMLPHNGDRYIICTKPEHYNCASVKEICRNFMDTY
ncbi:hypothetical protein [Paraclostridium bifermentans]|uniref:hypothetical protein n=1 Tax=Paraclostridium bifermentans TaxID=1490 RepID=UPI00189C2570|nr:hypothetical protein [Paraclostridium bifermentans]